MPRTATPRKKGSLSFRYRMARFILFNIMLAFVPIMLSISFHLLSNVDDPPSSYAPELLFFSVVITATVLGDISDELYRGGADEWLLGIAALLMLALIVSAALYGGYQFGVISRSQNAIFVERITIVSGVLSMVLSTASVGVEALLARTQQTVVAQSVTPGKGKS
jgi:hypothetical protein